MFMQKFKKRGSARLTAILLAAGLVFSNAGTVNARGEGYDIVDAGIGEVDTAITREEGTGLLDKAEGELLSGEEGWEEAAEDEQSPQPSEAGLDENVIESSDLEELVKEAEESGMETSDMETDGMETSDLEMSGMETEQEASGEGGFATESEVLEAEENDDSGEELLDTGDDDPLEGSGASDDAASGDGQDVLRDAASEAESGAADDATDNDSKWESEELNEGDELESSDGNEGDELESSDGNEGDELESSDEDEGDEAESSDGNEEGEAGSFNEDEGNGIESSAVFDDEMTQENDLTEDTEEDETDDSDNFDEEIGLSENEGGILDGAFSEDIEDNASDNSSEEETTDEDSDEVVNEKKEENIEWTEIAEEFENMDETKSDYSDDDNEAIIFEEVSGEETIPEEASSEGMDEGSAEGIPDETEVSDAAFDNEGEDVPENNGSSELIEEEGFIDASSEKDEEIVLAEGSKSVFDDYKELEIDEQALSGQEDNTVIHTVTFDANGGIFQNGYGKSEQVEDGEELTLYNSAEVAFKQGYVMAGWATGKDAVEAEYTDSFKPESDITLYIVWKQVFTVTFYPNGGRFTDGSKKKNMTVVSGDSVSPDDLHMMESLVERGDYTVTGWTEGKDGTGRLISSENLSLFYPKDNISLYAKWDYLCTIKFDANGGKFAEEIADKKVNYGHMVFLDVGEHDAARKNYVLVGWTEDREGTGAVWTSSYLVKKNMTFYAKWEKEKKLYTVKFNGNGGKILDEQYKNGIKQDRNYEYIELKSSLYNGYGSSHYYCEKYADRECAVKDGYILLGWTEKKNKGKILTGDYRPQKNITLYAYWAPAYRVTLEGNGGKLQSGESRRSFIVGKGDYIELPDQFYTNSNENFFKDGYEIAGWTVKKNKGEVTSGRYWPTKDITLYAKWTKGFTVTLNAGKGWFNYNEENKSHIKKMKFGKGVGTGLGQYTSIPYLEGKLFEGWYYDKSFKKPLRSSDTVTKNVTLYAKWQDKLVKVTLMNLSGIKRLTTRNVAVNPEDFADGTYSYYIRSGSSIGLLAASSISGNGTSILLRGNINFYFDSELTMPFIRGYVPSGDVTLYADNPNKDRWLYSFYINWDANGGYQVGDHGVMVATGHETDKYNGIIEMMPGEKLNESMYYGRNFRREGYYFAGWYDADDAYQNVLPRNHEFTKKVHIKAKWKKGVKVTVNLGGGWFEEKNDNELYLPSFDVRKGTVGISLPVPVRYGYDFAGWKNTITGKTLPDLDNEKVSKPVTYNAVWKKTGTMKMDSVTLTLIGGDGSIHDQYTNRYLSSVKIKVPKGTTYMEWWLDGGSYDADNLFNKYKKDNISRFDISYDTWAGDVSFLGWALTKKGKVLEEDYCFNSDKTLYSVFDDYYRIILVLNGGSYEDSDSVYVTKSVIRGKTLSLPDAETMSREGYKFAGWYSDNKLQKKVANPGKYKPKKDMHLFAKWTLVDIDKITLKKSSISLKLYHYYDLKNNLKVSPASAFKEKLEYKSNKPGIALVTEDGVIKGLKKGTAKITVSYKKKKAVLTVTVK